MKRDKLAFVISPTLFVMVLLLTFFGYFTEVICYAATVVLHEMAHAEVAHRLGYRLYGIRFAVYGARLTGGFEGVKWRDEFLIALAGPLLNLALAVVLTALWWLVPSTYFFTSNFADCNLYIALFNLLPIFPLDGGRMLLSLMSAKMKRKKAYKVVRIAGFFGAAIFAAVFAYSFFVKRANFSYGIISLFILFNTLIPEKHSHYERLYAMGFRYEKLKKGLPLREIMISEETTLLQLCRMLSGSCFTRFSVCDDKLAVMRTITETELEQFMTVHPPTAKVAQLLSGGYKAK